MLWRSVNPKCWVLTRGVTNAGRLSYLQRQVRTITEVDTLEAAVVVVVFAALAIGISAVAVPLVLFRQGKDAIVRDAGTLDEADSLQLGQASELHDRVIGKVGAAAQVDVTDAVAGRHQFLNGLVGDVAAVAEMNIVQALP